MAQPERPSNAHQEGLRIMREALVDSDERAHPDVKLGGGIPPERLNEVRVSLDLLMGQGGAVGELARRLMLAVDSTLLGRDARAAIYGEALEEQISLDEDVVRGGHNVRFGYDPLLRVPASCRLSLEPHGLETLFADPRCGTIGTVGVQRISRQSFGGDAGLRALAPQISGLSANARHPIDPGTLAALTSLRKLSLKGPYYDTPAISPLSYGNRRFLAARPLEQLDIDFSTTGDLLLGVDPATVPWEKLTLLRRSASAPVGIEKLPLRGLICNETFFDTLSAADMAAEMRQLETLQLNQCGHDFRRMRSRGGPVDTILNPPPSLRELDVATTSELPVYQSGALPLGPSEQLRRLRFTLLKLWFDLPRDDQEFELDAGFLSNFPGLQAFGSQNPVRPG